MCLCVDDFVIWKGWKMFRVFFSCKKIPVFVIARAAAAEKLEEFFLGVAAVGWCGGGGGDDYDDVIFW